VQDVISPDSDGLRSVRLPISGEVVQWLSDGRWRMVSRDQFETEQSRSPRLLVLWNSPADVPEGMSSDGHLAAEDGSPAWHRWWGAVRDEAVEARYGDGCPAAVIVAEPLWIVESLDSVGKVYVAVGEPFAEAVARQRVMAQVFARQPGPTSADENRGWWGSPPTASSADQAGESRPADAVADEEDHVDPRVRQGIAYVVWNDNSVQRALGRGIAEPDYYSCSLQPFGGQRLPSEDGPEVSTLDEALAWARARTSTILVRPQWDPGHHYRATDQPPSEWKRQG
jgi:hypothetical protein